MFNAETLIIGFTSGTLGVLITCLLCIPINLILHHLTGIGNLNAFLSLPVALILIAISMMLTLIAGIIPSRSAAKKGPVVAAPAEAGDSSNVENTGTGDVRKVERAGRLLCFFCVEIYRVL